jgi:hypothetical protein
LLPCQQYL